MLSVQSDAFTLGDIARWAERGEAWMRKYRQSLHDVHIIRVDGDGSVSFSIPYFASYLRRVTV